MGSSYYFSRFDPKQLCFQKSKNVNEIDHNGRHFLKIINAEFKKSTYAFVTKCSQKMYHFGLSQMFASKSVPCLNFVYFQKLSDILPVHH
jgi:hypothetical protein